MIGIAVSKKLGPTLILVAMVTALGFANPVEAKEPVVIDDWDFGLGLRWTCYVVNVTSPGIVVVDPNGVVSIRKNQQGLVLEAPDAGLTVRIETEDGVVGRMSRFFGEGGVAIEARVRSVKATVKDLTGRVVRRAVHTFTPEEPPPSTTP